MTHDFRRRLLACGAAVAVVGVVTLLGWVFGPEHLAAFVISSILIVIAVLGIWGIRVRSARPVGNDLKRAEQQNRRVEQKSGTSAAELQSINVTLERRVHERTIELERSRDHLEHFFTISTSLQDPDNFEKTLDLILGFCETQGYHQAMICLVDKDAGVIRAVKALGTMTGIVGLTVRALDGNDILAVAVRGGRTLVVADSIHDDRTDKFAAVKAGVRGLIVVPLISGAEVIGTLQVGSRTALNPSPAEIRTLENLGSHAARALSGLAQLKEVRRLNTQLEERNRQLQKLADDLAARAESEVKAHDALKDSEARFQAILDNSPAIVYVKDTEGRFRLINRSFETRFRFSRDQVIGRTNHDLFPSEWADAMRANDQKVLNQHLPLEFEEEVALPDGVHTYLSIKFPLSDSAGVTYSVCGIDTDITERKKAEEIVRHTAEELARSNQQLQKLAAEVQESARSEHEAHESLKRAQGQMVQAEKLAAIGQLVAGVAHEINNPLSFVSNNVAVLQRDVGALRQLLLLYQEAETVLATTQPELKARIAELADRIDLTYTLENLDRLMVRSRDGLKRIQQIVKDLRDFARLDESDLHEIDLNAGIESTVNIIQGQAKQQQVALQLQLEPLPPVTCYPAKINQVVLNLVANAIDATPAGGKVTVSSSPKDRGVELCVADTGTGIDPAIRDKIFDPFFTTKPQGKGTGLGLSISYGIVRSHGGKIDLESAPGKGTCFRIWLPLRAKMMGKES